MELPPLPLFGNGSLCEVMQAAYDGHIGSSADLGLNEILTWEMPSVQLLPI